MISQSSTVEAVFGYWPDFADAKIMTLAFEPSVIRIDLSYIDAQLQRAAIVGLRFNGVENLELTELRSENVLDRLTISSGTPLSVNIDAAYGLSGTFTCTGAEVTGVAPNKSFKPKPLRGSA